VVHDAYLANNMYGQAMAKIGKPLEDALTTGNIYAYGTSGFTRNDQPEDQEAIASGWFEVNYGEAFPEGSLTPSDYEFMKKYKPEFCENPKNKHTKNLNRFNLTKKRFKR
jgi:hypothetical protein